ncbi:hypothetical protein T492DRAFT_1073312 [Pavlovales sp. CCMP2436]|nr:hypothetical protein T492DRAFT_1073312 [Pavlovales sp. CCMP2436]
MADSAPALNALCLRREQLVMHGLGGNDVAIALCEQCDALAEALFGRRSRDFALSLNFTAQIYRQAAEAKGGGKMGKKETQRAIALLTESAAVLAETAGEHHDETARTLYKLSTALASSGSKPDSKSAQIVHAQAMAALWHAHGRPELAERSISQVALALAETHLGGCAHADAAGEGLRVSFFLRDALTFEEGGAAGQGGLQTTSAHALRAALARVLEIAGDLPGAVAAAEVACEALSRGIKACPPRIAAARIIPFEKQHRIGENGHRSRNRQVGGDTTLVAARARNPRSSPQDQPDGQFATAPPPAGVALQLAHDFCGAGSMEVAEVLESKAKLHESATQLAQGVEAWQQAGRIIKAELGEADARYGRCMQEQTRLLTAWTAQALAPPLMPSA